MKLFAAHTSPTLAATLAAATISLSVFLLPGAGVQSAATPLLPELGLVAGRIPANLPVAPRRRSHRVVHHASVIALFSSPTSRAVPQPRPAAPTPRPVRRAPVRHVEHTVAPTTVAAPVVPATPKHVESAPAARGRARGHDRIGRQPGRSTTARAHGHGRALGHSTPPGHARGAGHGKHDPAPATGSPAADVHGNGNGNGNGVGGGNGSGNANGHKKGDR